MTGVASLATTSTVPSSPRDVSSIADALTARQAQVERSSVRLGAALVLGAYLIAALLATGVPALAWLADPPAWVPPALITGGAAVAVAAMPVFLLPASVLDAWTAYTHLALAGHMAWLGAHGTPFPDATNADAWIAAHPGEEHRLARAQVLVMNGRAREADIPDEDVITEPGAAFLRAQLAFIAAFTAGHDAAAAREAADARDLVAQQPTGRDRRTAAATVSLLDAFLAFGREGDWVGALAAGRRELGPIARGTVMRWLVWPRLRYYGRWSLAIFVVALLVNAVAGGALDGMG